MKIVNNLIFVLVLSLPIFFLRIENNNCIEKETTGIEHLIPKPKQYQKNIKFEDEEAINITARRYSIEGKIDSIKTVKKQLKCVYEYCIKGSDMAENLKLLKTTDSLDYESIKTITTAHVLIIKNDTLSFNGRKGIKGCSSLKRGSKVYLNCSIYKLYSKNQNIANFMILDKITLLK